MITDMAKWLKQDSWQIEKKTLRKTSNSAVPNIALEREEKERKRRELLQHGVFVFGAPGTKSNRAYLLSEQDAVLSLWHNSTLDIFCNF